MVITINNAASSKDCDIQVFLFFLSVEIANQNLIHDVDDPFHVLQRLCFQPLRSDEYVARGVRYPYHGELDGANDTFAQNLEPEYITYNYDDTKAFVGLQVSPWQDY